MAKYAIYRTDLGTSTARPVTGVFEIPDEPAATFATRLAAQEALIEASEAIAAISEASTYSDEAAEESTRAFTIDPTVSPAVMAFTVVDRYSLDQRRARYRAERERRISEALPYAQMGREFALDSTFEDWLTYLNDLRNLADDPADPESVVFPSAPSTSESGGLSVFRRFYRRANVVGEVGEIGDVPTGPLFERSTTTNGTYAKFAGGIMLCSHRMALTYNTASSLEGTWTFPHTFGTSGIDRRAVLVTLSTKDNADTIPAAQIGNPPLFDVTPMTNSQGVTSSVQIQIRDSGSRFVSGDIAWVELFAMGRWDV